ncbi:MAG: hypothetical protein HY652_02575 [Acidobacteria bacterium]|nr:hypothetical protein [Acidobacteriota bacterium]
MAVLFTGAGASKPFGYPTTKEFFTQEFRGNLGELNNLFGWVANFCGSQPETVDVEAVLALLEPIQDFLQTPAGSFLAQRIDDNWAQAIPQLVQRVKDACFSQYGTPPKLEDVHRIYEPQLENLFWKRSCIPLFTTNYDPVTDYLLKFADKRGMPAFDGFNSRGEWDPSGYGKEKSGLEIYHLHGSLSWFRDGEAVKNLRVHGQIKGRESDHLLIYPGFKGNAEDA